ncbi:MAG: hypothetical protein JNJ72_20735, partial [Anaerolineales bacterium]|nr:hypothetical protein [Anaerolineales bacterium]
AFVAVFLNVLNGPAPVTNQPTQARIQAEDAKKKAAEEQDGLKNEPNGVALPASLEKKP